MKSTNLKLIALVILFSNCKSISENRKSMDSNETIPDMHTSEIALDWNGIYEGTLPCADCEGIETTIQVKKNLTFASKQTYLGKNVVPLIHHGTFSWNEAGNIITLSADDNTKRSYFVGENTLTHLDNDARKITGDLASKYVLQKQNISFTETHWKLIELHGKEVKDSGAFITFKNDNIVHGNGGCNNFNGTYELKEGNRILLSKMATTLMACPSMEVENAFLPILEMADNYSLNGDTMTLNKARMAPLARFEAVIGE